MNCKVCKCFINGKPNLRGASKGSPTRLLKLLSDFREAIWQKDAVVRKALSECPYWKVFVPIKLLRKIWKVRLRDDINTPISNLPSAHINGQLVLRTKKSGCTFSQKDFSIFYKSFIKGTSHLFSIGHEFRRRTANRHLCRSASWNLKSFYGRVGEPFDAPFSFRFPF